MNPQLDALFVGLFLGLALFALLACAPERLKDHYMPEQFALLAGPR